MCSKGSLVNAERTRFDFAHNAPVTDEQIRTSSPGQRRNPGQRRRPGARDGHRIAQKTGAMMLFGESTAKPCVLDIGSSRELCGGTHVKATGDIGLFKVVAEGGVAAGVRRIEAA